MDAVSAYLSNLNIGSLLTFALLLVAGSLIIGGIGRFVFGKHSTLSLSVSSAIDIIFIYVLNIVLHSMGAAFTNCIAPLPFISIAGDTLSLFSFSSAHFSAICEELFGLIILSFLMNLIDHILPEGKNIFLWLLLRILTLVLGQAVYLLTNWLIVTFLPTDLMTYTPIILLGILLLMLLTGSLKYLLGLFLATVSPVIAVLYTFFFCNIIGKKITQAVISTAMISLVILGLEKLGISSVGIALEALTVYIPFLLILLALWYILRKLF